MLLESTLLFSSLNSTLCIENTHIHKGKHFLQYLKLHEVSKNFLKSHSQSPFFFTLLPPLISLQKNWPKQTK